jgi:hypothetical protein
MKIQPAIIVLLFGFLTGLSACSPTSSPATPTALLTATSSPVPTVTVTSIYTSTPDNRLPPERWQEWPVVPVVSQRMIEIYRQGQAQGRNPESFSKIGDCQNVATYFLGVFDTPGEYSLGEYAALQPTIDQFNGSWSRTSLAVKGGMNVLSQLSPIWADPKQCNKMESPLACELRVNNPSIVIISLETWWGQQPAKDYEAAMRQVVEYVLPQGVVPILATKADNLEGDNSINAAIARVAYDYDLPLWNFWAAVQPLSGHGLTEDGFHLTFAQPFFDDPIRMREAWPWRNLTALQSIDSVWHGLTASQP